MQACLKKADTMVQEEELAKLKNLVFRTLENRGVMGQIRAQIRQNVYFSVR